MEYQSSFIWLFDEQWMIRWKMINGNYGYSTKTKKMDRKIDYRNILKINCKLINSFDDAMGLSCLKSRRISPKNSDVLKNKITKIFPNCQDMRRLIALTFADLLKGFSGLYIL